MGARIAGRWVAAWLFAGLLGSTLGCAEGVPAAPAGWEDSRFSLDVIPPPGLPDASAGTGAMPMEVAGAGTGAGTGSAVATGTPCTRGDMMACPCEGVAAEGQRVCMANSASPSGGFFTDCFGCPTAAPDAGPSCTNVRLDGAESATDCGGGVCDPCAVGQACATASDCMSGVCEGQLCVAMSAGSGGMSATGGSGGSGGSGGMSPTGGTGGMDEPQDECSDCDGFLECCRRDGTCGRRVLLLCL